MTKRLGTKAMAASAVGAVLAVAGLAGASWACGAGATARSAGAAAASEVRTAAETADGLAFYGVGSAELLAEEVASGVERPANAAAQTALGGTPANPGPVTPASDVLDTTHDAIETGRATAQQVANDAADVVEHGARVAAAGLGDGQE